MDENLPVLIARRLADAGHEVVFARELGRGRPDAEVLGWAGANQLIVTEDKDFGDLVFRDKYPTHGVLLVRLAGLSPDRRAALVTATIAKYGHGLLGSFSVLSAGGIRTQPLPGQTP